MKRCFGYIRVSTVKQGEGVSLEAQRAAIEQFSARNDITITEWFEEKQTAAKSGRPVFAAMLKRLRGHKADGVVMHKIDRSARNFADWAKIGDLSDAGIDVHFAAESLDFRSRGGRLSADIQAVIAADYVRNLRDETLKGLYGRLDQGLYPWGAPIGYRNNGGGKPKTIDPATAPLVRQMFDLYATGRYSIVSLRDEMKRRGLRNGAGMALTKTGVETVLGNPFYCGVIRLRKSGTTYRGIHEPLIPVPLFHRVQELKRGKYVHKTTRHDFTYRKLFRCGHCNAPMTPERQKGRVYYRCQTRNCPTKCIREDVLEAAVHAALSSIALTGMQIVRAAEAIAAWAATDRGKLAVQGVELQLLQLERRLDALTDALVDRLIDKDMFNRRKEALLLERAGLEEDLVQSRRDTDIAGDISRFLELIKSLAASYLSAKSHEKTEIVEIVISNRRVFGKNLTFAPSNWVLDAQTAVTDLLCGPNRDADRTSDTAADATIRRLTEVMRSEDAKRLRALSDGRAANDNTPSDNEKTAIKHRNIF